MICRREHQWHWWYRFVSRLSDEPTPFCVTQVSCANAHNVVGVNSAGGIYKWGNDNWFQLPGALTWVSIGVDGAMWGVNSSQNIYRWTGSDWAMVPGAAVQSGCTRLAHPLLPPHPSFVPVQSPWEMRPTSGS